MACNYHHARDVFPHNPRHKVIYFTGEHFFPPDRRRYGHVQPVVSPLAEGDPLRVLVEKAHQRGMAVRGWVNFLHNSRLGQQHPECVVANAFVDRDETGMVNAVLDQIARQLRAGEFARVTR